MELLQPNQIFANRYRVERALAQGGMGAVFVAHHLATEQQVALKVLWPQLLGSPELIESFQLEAKVAARLDCEHVVQVLDAGFDSGMPFLVMELLRGETLASKIQEAGAMPGAEVVAVLRQVARALDRAHGYVDRDGKPSPIIHRDLKPENIFLCQRPGAEPLVKVLDFGIAKVLSEATMVSADIKGTPTFMAHEQAIAARVSPQTDIWPLALIAFQALTGRHFWRTMSAPEGATIAAILLDLVSHPAYSPSQRLAEMGLPPSQLPPSFDRWFEGCTRRDPATRYQRASEAVEALEAAFQGRPVPVPEVVARAPEGAPTLPPPAPSADTSPLSVADTHAAPGLAAPRPSAPQPLQPTLGPPAEATTGQPPALSDTLAPLPLEPGGKRWLPLAVVALLGLAAVLLATRGAETPQPALTAATAVATASVAAAVTTASAAASAPAPASAQPAGELPASVRSSAPAQQGPRPQPRHKPAPTQGNVYGER